MTEDLKQELQRRQKSMYTIKRVRIDDDVVEYQVTDGQNYYPFYDKKEAEECMDNLNKKGIITPELLRELGL